MKKFLKFGKVILMLALGCVSYMSIQGCEASWYEDYFGKGGSFRS